jgi:hypothetical protein
VAAITFAGLASLPGHWAVVPEWISAANAISLLSVSIVVVVLARWLWLWIRWWSLPITLALTVIAVLLACWPAQDLVDRMRANPAEGFLYSSSLACGVGVDGVLGNASTHDRIYVLQQYCVPDGPEERTVYVRHGSNVLMEELDPKSDSARICEAWLTSRTWVSRSRFNEGLVNSCQRR